MQAGNAATAAVQLQRGSWRGRWRVGDAQHSLHPYQGGLPVGYPVETAVHPPCHRQRVVLVGEVIQAARLPELAGNAQRDRRIGRLLRVANQVEAKKPADRGVVGAAGYLYQATATKPRAVPRLVIAEVRTAVVPGKISVGAMFDGGAELVRLYGRSAPGNAPRAMAN